MPTLNESIDEPASGAEPKKPWYKRLRKPSKQMFWVWVGYQAVKGTLTTSFIWIPLFWAWLH